MKKITLLFASLFLTAAANAAQRSYFEIQEAARGALLRQANYNRLFKVRQLAQPMQEIYAESHLHVFASEGTGAVVVCDDDRLDAVLGVTDAYTPGAELPDGLRFYLQQVSRNIEAGSHAKALAPLTEVENFVPTQWGQDKPFNGKTPMIGGVNAPAGCVAICMSQIMYTYSYPTDRPVFNKDNGDYYITNDKVVPYSTPKGTGLFKEPTVYTWSQMLENYKNGYTTAQGQEVQRLVFDCGVSVHMQYNRDGSGAAMYNVPAGMSRHFGYDSLSVASPMAVFYTQQEWQELIYGELMQKAPVIYSATEADDSNGHAFLFSGLRADGKVYVNWGWNGDYDGWYDIANLKPENDPNNLDFCANQHVIVGIRPEAAHPSGLRQATSASLLGVEGVSVKVDKGDLQFRFSSLYNLHWRDLVGDAAILLMKDDDPEWTYGLTLMQSGEEESADALPYGTGWQMNQPVGFLSLYEEDRLSDMPAGTYYFGVFSMAVDEEEMQIARAPELGRVMWRVTVEDNHRVTAVELMTQEELDQATAVNAPKADVASNAASTDATYNLAGQRVPRASRGLVIRNGKKFLQK